MRHGRLFGQHRALGLQAQGARGAIPGQRASGTLRVARRADLRAQVHQGLVKITGLPGGQLLARQAPQLALARG